MRPARYFQATRHPWASLLFVVPLLALYEGGMLFFGHGAADSLRNGADAWLRGSLAQLGLAGTLAPPLFLLALLVFWTFVRWPDRPDTDVFSLWTGMLVESAVFAAGLWVVGQSFRPFLESLGLNLAQVPAGPSDAAQVRRLIGYVGAGIYEEALFRLLLFAVLTAVLARVLDFPLIGSAVLAAIASALAFAAAHHFGEHGEVFQKHVFLFRAFAGLYFALLYQLRGFGIAVGAHAAYDVFVALM